MNTSTQNHSAPSLTGRAGGESVLVPRKYLFTFILITSLFALWGFANDITNPMVAAFQTLMEISAAKASMVQFAFYGGYATMAIPAALFIRKYSYKVGVLIGLGLYAVGAFLFIPPHSSRSSPSSACRSTSSPSDWPSWRPAPTPSSCRWARRRTVRAA